MMNNKPTSTPRVNTFRERQERLNRWPPKQYYVTDDEHKFLKRQLERYRNNQEYADKYFGKE